MANELKVAKVLSIKALHAQGWSQRRIARELGSIASRSLGTCGQIQNQPRRPPGRTIQNQP